MSAEARPGPLAAAAYSGAVAAGVAAASAAACGRALGAGASWQIALLAAAGTLVVYDIDRLRDLARDQSTSPRRSAFVERHQVVLRGVVAVAGATAMGVAWTLPWPVWLLCGAVLALGLYHRRLKQSAEWKSAYVTAAWLAVVVGLPALSGGALPEPARLASVLAAVAPAFAANLLATNAVGGNRARILAAATAALGTMWALAAGDPVRPLAALGAAELLCLAAYREDERYRAVSLDSALLAGAVGALVWGALGA